MRSRRLTRLSGGSGRAPAALSRLRSGAVTLAQLGGLLRVNVRRRLLALAALLSATMGCALADLRPPAVLDGVSESEIARGRARLEALADTYGGVAAWRRGAMRYELVDTWPVWLTRTVAMPWRASPQRLELVVQSGTDAATLALRAGPEDGEVWGIRGGRTTVSRAANAPADVDHPRARFRVPTLAYFLDMPFRLREAEVVQDAGDAERQGRRYHRVFATWRAAAPQQDLDQYLAWIDAETGRLAFVEYTIRELSGFLRGAMVFEGDLVADGVHLPRRMEARSALDDTETLHVIDVLSAARAPSRTP
jgi:hypothetical protein